MYTGQITIDGKGTFKYTLEPIGDAQAPSLPPPAPAQTYPNRNANGSNKPGETVTVLLLGHESKGGMGKNGKPYEIHKFRASDNRKYSTFNSEMVSALVPAVGSGNPVSLYVRENDFKGWDIVKVNQA